jgi:hypothetical protein
MAKIKSSACGTFYGWSLANHPDKGGDSELCAKIISAGRQMGY